MFKNALWELDFGDFQICPIEVCYLVEIKKFNGSVTGGRKASAVDKKCKTCIKNLKPTPPPP